MLIALTAVNGEMPLERMWSKGTMRVTCPCAELNRDATMSDGLGDERLKSFVHLVSAITWEGHYTQVDLFISELKILKYLSFLSKWQIPNFVKHQMSQTMNTFRSPLKIISLYKYSSLNFTHKRKNSWEIFPRNHPWQNCSLSMFPRDRLLPDGSGCKESDSESKETQVWSLGWKIPWVKKMATHSQDSSWKILIAFQGAWQATVRGVWKIWIWPGCFNIFKADDTFLFSENGL